MTIEEGIPNLKLLSAICDLIDAHQKEPIERSVGMFIDMNSIFTYETREAKIKMLEGLKDKTHQAIVNLINEPFYKLTPKNPARVNALRWQIEQFDNLISELREEGKEKGKV